MKKNSKREMNEDTGNRSAEMSWRQHAKKERKVKRQICLRFPSTNSNRTRALRTQPKCI